ncbi:MAG: DNA double-strand break repair nuclease NurA [Burkholderiales bacterium]|nr:DNA double-strand break repair nuclease NurA [Burkholderiales bacterium]
MPGELELPAEELRQRVETRLSLGGFMANMLRAARSEDGGVQHAFAQHLCETAKLLDGFLRNDGRVQRISYEPSLYWPKQKGRVLGFIDGGVANIALPGAAPLAIRVGSYVVQPGIDGPEREQFDIEVSIVDDLYDEDQDTYEDGFGDTAKLRDAARIIAEAGASRGLARRRSDLDGLLVHGPLINPVAPYGAPGFPAYTERASHQLSGTKDLDETGRHFAPLYRRILEDLRDWGGRVAGVVERDGGGRRFIASLLDQMVDSGKLDNARRTKAEKFLQKFSLSDTQLLDLILREGEYIQPVVINRQEPSSKWPQEWAGEIELFPNALTTFIKPSDHVQPIRMETFEGRRMEDLVALVLHTSRLLPGYGFPVGLDVADRFAKVPDWMGRQIATGHKVNLLRKAFVTDNEKVRDFSIRMLSATGRDWLYRPKI